MIAIPSNVRVWLATGHTDMRRGFPSLARLVQESLKRDPHVGDLYVFRGRRGDLIKIIWHDGQGACLFTKRLERGRFLWPSLADGVITISVAQLSYLLSGIDWRMPQATWRPQASGQVHRQGATVAAAPSSALTSRAVSPYHLLDVFNGSGS